MPKKPIAPKDRGPLMILTRKEGVRSENPLMKQGDYYQGSTLQRTAARRKDMDEIMRKMVANRRLGLQVRGR